MNFPSLVMSEPSLLASVHLRLCHCSRECSATTGRTSPPVRGAQARPVFEHQGAVGSRAASSTASARRADLSVREARQHVWSGYFRQPEAELIDANGKTVGQHGANFSFEHVDGSRLVATIVAYDDAPQANRPALAAADDAQLRTAARSRASLMFSESTPRAACRRRAARPPNPASCCAWISPPTSSSTGRVRRRARHASSRGSAAALQPSIRDRFPEKR